VEVDMVAVMVEVVAVAAMVEAVATVSSSLLICFDK
jgi:hypothetical protein